MSHLIHPLLCTGNIFTGDIEVHSFTVVMSFLRKNFQFHKIAYCFAILQLIFIFSTDFFLTKMGKILHLIQGNLLSALYYYFFNILFTQLVSRSISSASSPSRWSNPSVLSPSRITLFITRIRWFHVPLTFAATFVALGQLRKYRIKNIQSQTDADEVDIYKPSHLEVGYFILVVRIASIFLDFFTDFNVQDASFAYTLTTLGVD